MIDEKRFPSRRRGPEPYRRNYTPGPGAETVSPGGVRPQPPARQSVGPNIVTNLARSSRGRGRRSTIAKLGGESLRAGKGAPGAKPPSAPRPGTTTARIVAVLEANPMPMTIADLHAALPEMHRNHPTKCAHDWPDLVGSRLATRSRSSPRTYLWHRKHDRAARRRMIEIEKIEKQEQNR